MNNELYSGNSFTEGYSFSDTELDEAKDTTDIIAPNNDVESAFNNEDWEFRGDDNEVFATTPKGAALLCLLFNSNDFEASNTVFESFWSDFMEALDSIGYKIVNKDEEQRDVLAKFIGDDKFGEMMNWAVRYQLGRHRLASCDTARYLINLVPFLSNPTLWFLDSDVSYGVNMMQSGDIDYEEWSALLNAVKDEISLRDGGSGRANQ